MCGIYGITAKDEAFIENYITTCSHRGPDGQGIWSNDSVTLGHNLLAITETNTQSQQPWITPKGNILIYNGEIFNYFELLNRYPNFAPKTTCDTELLAWGLDEYGTDFIDEIDSMLNSIMVEGIAKSITLNVHPFIDAFLKKGVKNIQRQWFLKYKKW